MSYNNISEVNEAFVAQSLELTDTLTVDNTTFKLHEDSRMSIMDVVNENVGILLYVSEGTESIALIWEKNDRGAIVASHAAAVSTQAPILEADGADPKIIGDVVSVKITSLPNSQPIKGKVDTGATISSLHAERYKIVDERIVQFVCPQLSANVLQLPLIDQQAIKSADGGTEYRPVVELNVKINDKLLNNCQFNLNDRGTMDHPMLVGQNVLEKGGFLIDPRMNESESDELDWNNIIQEAMSSKVPTRNLAAEELYNIIKESDVSFTDLVKHITTVAAENNDIEY